MPDAEANLLCNAQRYERSAERKDTRTESYRRKLHTRAGQVKIAVPKLRALPFETAIIERIHAQENREEAVRKAGSVAKKLEVMKLGKAARLLSEGIQETLSYHDFPEHHHRRFRTNNPLERIMRKIRRRTRVAGASPDGNSALMLVAARLRHIAGTKWGLRQYLKMDRLEEQARELAA